MKLIYVLLLSLVIKTHAQTQRLEFEAPAAYPEGITFDQRLQVFYVSSVTDGTVGKVDLSGNYSVLYRDSTLRSTFGMKLSADGKKLWVCVGNPNYSKQKDSATYKKMIRLIGIALDKQQKIADIDLSSLFPGKHFPNDITLDNSGNIYMTDSFSPVIYKIDATGNPTLFAQHELFKAVGVGLNGIVWHPKGFLLVVNNGNGSLIKVTGSTAPSLVKINQFFPGADGLLLDREQRLILVQNKSVNKVFQLTSKDDWKSAEVTGATASKDLFVYPSTATFREGNVWVMNAKLNELSDSNTVVSNRFSIQKAVIK
ncbi:MAG: hypothetical protein QM802_20755 [Agriterribacter sp.]